MATPPQDEYRRAKQIRDIGTYTAIPTMLVVGPVLGWLAGRWAAGRWGHDATFETVGAMLGFAASVRQIQLILQRQTRRQAQRKLEGESKRRDGDGS